MVNLIADAKEAFCSWSAVRASVCSFTASVFCRMASVMVVTAYIVWGSTTIMWAGSQPKPRKMASLHLISKDKKRRSNYAGLTGLPSTDGAMVEVCTPCTPPSNVGATVALLP